MATRYDITSNTKLRDVKRFFDTWDFTELPNEYSFMFKAIKFAISADKSNPYRIYSLLVEFSSATGDDLYHIINKTYTKFYPTHKVRSFEDFVALYV